jgi:DNA mismatch endonuclease (patch repair protein)
MADVFTKVKRSEIMARIQGHGNRNTEVALVKVFRQHKISGWRRKQKVFGKPDFVFPKLKLAVFVDGCFWHGCPKHGTQPKNNATYWRFKIARNQSRDQLVTRKLRALGWRVLRIWEHEFALKNEIRLLKRISRRL